MLSKDAIRERAANLRSSIRQTYLNRWDPAPPGLKNCNWHRHAACRRCIARMAANVRALETDLRTLWF